ncbi:MAG: DUF1508 domain-containing protein [Clostridia bacterium]|nr:DUF1508 domain-containing protein [Clostridia bacterium]
MSKFLVKQTKDGFLFDLVANNGQIIASSQVYTTKAACLKGIKSVQNNAPDAPVEDQSVKNAKVEEFPKFEVYFDEAGEYRFRLRAGNREVIADSRGYKAKSSCVKGIESVRVNADEADIVEEKNTSGTASVAPDYSKPEC